MLCVQNGDVKDVEDKIRTITAENVVLRAAAEDAKKELLDSSKRVHISLFTFWKFEWYNSFYFPQKFY